MEPESLVKIVRLRRLRNLLVGSGVLFFVLIGIFPPWKALMDPDGARTMESLGYHFIGSPPHSPYGFKSYVILDYTRIFIQWGLAFLATFAAYRSLNLKISRETGNTR